MEPMVGTPSPLQQGLLVLLIPTCVYDASSLNNETIFQCAQECGTTTNSTYGIYVETEYCQCLTTEEELPQMMFRISKGDGCPVSDLASTTPNPWIRRALILKPGPLATFLGYVSPELAYCGASETINSYVRTTSIVEIYL
ncbi:unnamed protein product, partial [Mesorhabditis spiculigera]